MSDVTSVYVADIVKTAPQDDGSLLVYGKATDSSLDLDDQYCCAEWLGRAMPDWFTKANGAIREQHDPHRAVGKATEYEPRNDGHWITAKIVDPVAKAKVEAGIFSGFSIGIKSPRVIRDAHAKGGKIVDGRVIECSLVDVPANPGCTLTLAKAATADAVVAPEDLDEDRMLVKVEELHEAIDADVLPDTPPVMPTPRDLAARLSKAAQDLAVRLGTDATPDGDPAQPAVDPAPEPQADAEPDQAVETGTPPEPVATKAVEGDPAVLPGPALTAVSAGATVTYDTDALTSALIPSAPDPTVAKGAMAPVKEGGPKRYPISTVSDLKDAIQAFGRGKPADKAAIKAHIKSEARRLGRSDLIPANWKALLTKDVTALDDLDDTSGMKHDPAALRAILSGLANVMKAELDELVAGDDEYWDLSQLIRSMSAFTSWWACEAARGETGPPFNDSPPSYLEYAMTPDQTKAEAPDGVEIGATETTEAASPADEETRLAELVKTALADMETKLTTAAEERATALAAELATVKADLEKALALPEVGGPVITRTASQAAAAREVDANIYKAQAAEYFKKAESATDRTLRLGYQELGEKALAKAAA
jgi:hypothetical protein